MNNTNQNVDIQPTIHNNHAINDDTKEADENAFLPEVTVDNSNNKIVKTEVSKTIPNQ